MQEISAIHIREGTQRRMEIIHDSLYRLWTEIVIAIIRENGRATVYGNPSGIWNVYGMLKHAQVK